MNKPLIYFFLTFFLLNNFNVSGQINLVYNGDFEIYDTCPFQYSIVSNMELEHALGWKAPTTGTSDYFNSCNTNPNQLANVGVPNNFIGFQNAYNGFGYAGIYVYTNYINGSEYIQSKLLNTLKAGYSYKVSFYISQADSSEYSISEIGAHFSESAISRSDFAPFNYFPQVKSQSGLWLNNMIGWTKIEGTFVASGGEQYITIGNFKDSVLTDTMNTNLVTSTGSNAAYYYIDGVELIETGQTNSLPNFISPNGDSRNDLFMINFPFLKTVIYNRWGQRIFESQDGVYWDGKTVGDIEVPEGVYYYIIETKEKVFKGFLQLLR